MLLLMSWLLIGILPWLMCVTRWDKVNPVSLYLVACLLVGALLLGYSCSVSKTSYCNNHIILIQSPTNAVPKFVNQTAHTYLMDHVKPTY
jgi:hypothetical protein